MSCYQDEKENDRPNLAVRVFRIKLCAFIAFIIDANVFGEVKAHVRVIEFEKRGLSDICTVFSL